MVRSAQDKANDFRTGSGRGGSRRRLGRLAVLVESGSQLSWIRRCVKKPVPPARSRFMVCSQVLYNLCLRTEKTDESHNPMAEPLATDVGCPGRILVLASSTYCCRCRRCLPDPLPRVGGMPPVRGLRGGHRWHPRGYGRTPGRGLQSQRLEYLCSLVACNAWLCQPSEQSRTDMLALCPCACRSSTRMGPSSSVFRGRASMPKAVRRCL